jgi:type 1 fimbria pilin
MLRYYGYVLLSYLCLSQSAAADQGQGKVTMLGSIIATACAIDTASRDQTIDMETLPISQIVRDGRGNSRDFSIKLVNCDVKRVEPNRPDWRYFQVTFDGDNDAGWFGVQGKAEGVALKIVDSNGNIAQPGMPLPSVDVVPGNMLINYSMTLVANNKILRAGDYNSTIRFKMDYY